MIGGALVGTFLGVYLAYGFVGPIAARMKQTYEQDAQFYAIIRDCLVAYLHGHSAPIVGRAGARQRAVHRCSRASTRMDRVLEKLPTDPLAGHAREARERAARIIDPPLQ